MPVSGQSLSAFSNRSISALISSRLMGDILCQSGIECAPSCAIQEIIGRCFVIRAYAFKMGECEEPAMTDRQIIKRFQLLFGRDMTPRERQVFFLPDATTLAEKEIAKISRCR
jgi:hypothetical protein